MNINLHTHGKKLMKSEFIIIDYILTICDTLKLVHEITDQLTIDDFSDNTCQKAFAQIVKLVNSGIVPDLISVFNNSQFSDAGTHYQIGMDVQSHVQLLKSGNMRRDLMNKLKAAHMKLERGDAIEEIIPSVESAINRGSSVDLSKIKDVYAQIDDYQKRVMAIKGRVFKTGFKEIDKLIRGVAGGELMIVLGRPGSYKTATMQYMLNNYVHQDENLYAIIFSIEMPTATLVERYISSLTGWWTSSIEDAFCDYEGETTKTAIEKYYKTYKNIYVVDSTVKIHDIIGYIKAVENKHSCKVGLIGIDYLGLIDEPGKNEYEKISFIARALKILARRLDLPVLCLSQTSRQAGDGTQEVLLSHGRGSGAIEETADFCFGMWSENYTDTGDVLFLRILKNRKGPFGKTFEIEIDRTNFRFSGNAILIEQKKERNKA